MSEWISVEDRLPEEKVSVLVSGPVGFNQPFIAWHDGDYWLTVHGPIAHNRFGVTHWMPLPESPK